MTMDPWLEDFRLRIYEVGPDGLATATTMMNVFQEAASHHAESLGMGYPQLSPRSIGWALTKFRLTMDRYPRYGETVTIRTWPRAGKRIFAYRDVEFSVDGERVGIGSSVWCLLDLQARKALSLIKALDGFPCRDERLFPDEIPSVHSCDGAWEWCWSTTPRFSELDLNGHVNNSVYLGWAVEPLPRDYPFLRMPKEIFFAFKKEVSSDMEVFSRASRMGDDLTVHSLEDRDGGELAKVSIKWL